MQTAPSSGVEKIAISKRDEPGSTPGTYEIKGGWFHGL